MSDLEHLLARYAARDRLSDAEQAVLRAAAEKDPALRRALLDDLHMDGALRGEAGAALDGELFAQGVLDCLRAKRDESRFIERVQRRVRRSPRRSPAPTAWIAAAAAAVLVALLLSLASRPASPRPPTKPPPALADEPKAVSEPASAAPAATVEEPRHMPEQTFLPPPPSPAPDVPAVRSPEPAKPKPVEPAPPAHVATTEAALASVVGTGAPISGGRPLEGPLGIEFPDGTRVDLSAGARLSSITDVAGRDGLGRILDLERGGLRASVAKQPKGRAFAVRTPHGEARVVGTVFTLAVSSAGTRLEVSEGLVRLGSVDVQAGHYAVAAPGTAVAARPLREPSALERALEAGRRVVINFGPPGAPLPEGTLIDAGEAFDAARGYGWTTAGVKVALRTGTALDGLRATHAYGGTRDRSEVWKAAVPDGVYRLTVVVGDDREQGPQHVRVMGQVVINAVVTGREQFVEREIPVVVRQGELTVAIGGHGTSKKVRGAAGVASDDTTLCYLVIAREK